MAPTRYGHDDKITRIENKIDDVRDTIGEINSTLAAQHVSLEEHIRRTEILEREIAPIKRHVTMLQGVLAFFGAIAVLGGIIEGFVALLTYLRQT